MPVLKKPAGVWCQFNCASGAQGGSSGGCSVHGPALPAVCRQYDCYWREYELADDLRPDRLGLVITEAGNLAVGYDFPPVLVLHPIDAAAPNANAEQVLRDLVGQGFVAVSVNGHDAKFHFDPSQYPSLTELQIETALRQMFANDARELKQLGAASKDYDP